MFNSEFLLLVFLRVYCILSSGTIVFQVYEFFTACNAINFTWYPVVSKIIRNFTVKEIIGLSLWITSIFSWFIGW